MRILLHPRSDGRRLISISSSVLAPCLFSTMQVDGLVKLVGGRFLALTSHVVATALLFFGKTPLVQIDLDTPQTMDQYEYTDNWWVFAV